MTTLRDRKTQMPSNLETEIQSHLFSLRDLKYKEFHQRLVPGIEPERIIGVRVPALRIYAKELSNAGKDDVFMSFLPHRYYDENCLHGLLIGQCRDFDKALAYTDAFLPYIDNWAVCDITSPKIFKKHSVFVYEKIKGWILSSHTYTVRFAVGLLLSDFLDDKFQPDMLSLAADIKSEEYYINMMISWYFATALAKRYDVALPYLKEHRLSAWVHNKTIQKATESFRVSSETKAYLKTLKIK